MIQTWLMYVCLAALAVLGTMLLAIGYHRLKWNPVEKGLRWFRGLPLFWQIVLGLSFGHLFVYASTKPQTNDVDNVSGGSTNVAVSVEGGTTNETWAGEGEMPTNPPPMLMFGALPMPGTASGQDGAGGGFSAEEIAAGYVLARVGSNEVWSAEPPVGATVIGEWLLRGASDDRAEIVDGASTNGADVAVFANGRVLMRGTLYAALDCDAGVVPECNWTSNVASRVWWMRTEIGSLLVTWEDVLANRDTNTPVSVQAEFYSDGNWRYRYGPGAVTNGVTSRFFRRLKPEDWLVADADGDGLSTYDEIMTYHTSPYLVDTDGDGLDDGYEVCNGLDPLDPDQDHDGIVDGGDNDAETAISPVDQDGDGIPDEYETHWFGSTDVWDDPTERDANGFTLEGMMKAGLRPSDTIPTATTATDGRFSAIKLWDRFAADWSSTNSLVFERTIQINRSSNWQQFYLSSSPDGAGGWTLRGLTLEWADSDGETGTATSSPEGDSLYLPLSTNGPYQVTFRLRATGGRVRSTVPVYLLEYVPEVSITGGRELELSDGSTASVFTKGSKSTIGVTIDRSGRPCHASPCDREMIMDGFSEMGADGDESGFTYVGNAYGGTIIVDGAGSFDLPSFSVGELTDESRQRLPLLMMTCNGGGGGHHVIVLDPSVWYGTSHGHAGNGLCWSGGGYYTTYAYPLDSDCLVREWHHGDYGWSCDCEPGVSSGVSEGAAYVSTQLSSDGSTAYGSVLVDGHVVWSDTATHDSGWYDGWYWGWDGIEYESCCCSGCADGDCSSLEGPGVDSLKFRIPFGSHRKGQVAGFVYFETQSALTVTPSIFEMVARDDVYVRSQTSGSTRTFSCYADRCRDIIIAPISGGVRITVNTHSSGDLEHTWEVTNVNGSPNRIRLRKISRLDNVMEDWLYERGAGGDGDWRAVDAQTGVSETLDRTDNLSTGGTSSEIRRKYDADGNFLGSVQRVNTRIGERENAVLRETYYREENGRNTIVREATYWEDSEHRARNGKLKLLTATDKPWSYHAWDKDGREIMRVEQRNGSVVPSAFPSVGSDGSTLSGVSGLASAFVTVYGYAPVSGDDCFASDFSKVRCETRYAVEGGAGVMIARTWYRYTHDWYMWYPTVKCEQWRAAGATASFGNASNAYSYRVRMDEGDSYSYIPFALHGAEIETLDEDGVLSASEVWDDYDRLILTTRRSFGVVCADTYEIRELDPEYGNVLRRATCLSGDDSVIAEEVMTYDEQNRLRSKSYLDGTSEIHQYSCCRRLWSVDREGRKTLRSAVTGEDRQYWADEEVWLRAVTTCGVHRVTQHFCDGFGRETNTVVYLASAEGEAVAWSASNGRRIASDVTAYAGIGDDSVASESRSGRCATLDREKLASSETTTEAEFDGEGSRVETETRVFRNGSKTVRREWDGKWTERETVTAYDATGCRTVTETVDASDHEPFVSSSRAYDFLGRLVSETTPFGTTSYVYDGTSGRVLSETHTSGGVVRTVVRHHDALGAEIGKTADGLTSITETSYVEESNVWWRVCRLTVSGDVTNAVRETRTQLTGLGDGLRSHTALVAEDGIRTDTVLEVGGEPGVTVETVFSSVASPVVRTLLYGLPVEERTASGTTRFEYDGLGQLVRKVRVLEGIEGSEEEIGCVSFAYDAAGNLQSETARTNATGGATTSYAYDAFGRVVSETDAAGNVVETAYDSLGAVVSVGGDANRVRYAHDTAGRRTQVRTTRNGSTWDTTTWTYSPATGLCTGKRYANNAEETTTYRADGLPLRRTLASGMWTENAYDTAGRLSGTTSSDGRATVAYVRDASGRVTSETGSVCSYAYSVADDGAVTNETVTVGSSVETIIRGFDGCGRPVGRGLESRPWQTVGYDEEGRIASASGSVVCVVYSYGADGSDTGCTMTVPGGVIVRRDVIRDKYTGAILAVTNRVNGTVVCAFDYVRDALGRPLSRNGDVFSYDAAGQVAAAVVGGEPTGYFYDAAGNFSSVMVGTNGEVRSYAANACNQYTVADGAACANSPDGGLSSWGGYTFAYDAAERLWAVYGADGAIVANDYDGRGRRVRKIAADGTHLFVWDGWNPVLESIQQDGVSLHTFQYVWGRDIEGSLEAAGGVGALVAVVADGIVYLPLYDGMGNVVAYVDGETGAVAAEFAYDAFGRTLSATGQQAELFRFRHATKYTEPETGLVYYGRRFYCPAIGRWTSRDPVGEDAGANLYAFCGNAATWKYDVLGALTFKEAVENYRSGAKSVMDMDISEIGTSGVSPDDFSAVSGYLSSCSKGTYSVGYDENTYWFNTGGWVAAYLGSILLKAKGELTIASNGDWSFSGTMKAREESFDFKPNGTNWLRDVMTWIAGDIIGEGHPFTIRINGTKPLSGSGNCCRKSWWRRWW